MNVASDMIDGKSFQDSAKCRLKEGIQIFVKSNPIIPQSGSGVRRKRRRQPSRKQSKKSKSRGLQICLHSMAFIHDQSCECAKTELNVFSVPSTETSIEYGNYVEYHPLNSITDSGPIEFDVSCRVDKITWILQILSYSSKLRLLEVTGTTLPMQITSEESTCFDIA